MRFRLTLLCGAVALLVQAGAGAAPPGATAVIDRRIAAGWETAKVAPAAPADDAEFLRRVYLDVTGRIPGATEARQFLDDKDPAKREKLVDKLLASQNYANHFTNIWRALLLPEANTNLQARFQQQAFQGWIHGHLEKNTPYDAMVRELLTASLAPAGGRGGAIGFGDQDPSPSPFFYAKDLMPENLAAATTRVFLGVKLECAQCHDHPFANWKREQFWSFSAFFAGIKRQRGGDIVTMSGEDTTKHEIGIPNTERVVKAKFLDGKEPAWANGAKPRETLADWVTKSDNPYFAKAAVNRMWAYFFGTGVIDPVDEMVGGESSNSHPELLDELAKAFAESKFDMKFLIKAIVLSKPYQLTSRAADGSAIDPRLFARMPLRGLTPAQLFDSLVKATGLRAGPSNSYPGVNVVGGRGDPREEFLSRFGSGSEKSTEHQTSILNALALMNGRVVADATSLERSETLSGILGAPFFDDAGKIEAVYLAALSRRPTDKETTRLTKFVSDRTHKAKDAKERDKLYQEALADVFWVLLNSGEFMLNH